MYHIQPLMSFKDRCYNRITWLRLAGFTARADRLERAANIVYGSPF